MESAIRIVRVLFAAAYLTFSGADAYCEIARTPAEKTGEAKTPRGGTEPHNLVRCSRLPLGLQSGWSLYRDYDDGDDVLIASDRGIVGPSGSPALRILSAKEMMLFTAPFPIPSPTLKYTASFYIHGKATGEVRAVRASKTLGHAALQIDSPTAWKRIVLTFQPDPVGDDHALKFIASGDFWIDGLQVEQGERATPYAPRMECEVALACALGEAAAARIQFDNEPAEIGFCVTGEGEGKTLKAKAVNAYGDTKDLPSVALKRGFMNEGRLRYDVFPDKPYGAVRVEAWVEDGQGRRASSFNELVVTRLRRPRYWMKDAPDSPFGTHTLSVTRHILMVKAAGINWTRFHDAGLRYIGWYHVEPEKGKWTFFDKEIQRYRKYGVEILAELGTAPKWASYYQKVGVDHHPLRDRYYRPLDMEDYANYVRVVTRRYKGVIAAWDMWNEPWGGFWWASYDESKENNGGYRTSQNASKEFVELMKAGYGALKSVDPSLPLAGVCTVGTVNKGTPWTEGIIRNGGLPYCDILDYHTYLWGNDRVCYPGDRVEQNTKYALGALYDKNGALPKPAWMTEGNSVQHAVGPGLYHYTITKPNKDDVMATGDRLCRFAISLLSQGVKKVFYYSVHCHNYFDTNPQWGFLTTDEGYFHPSGAAISAMTWLLEDTRFVKRLQLGDGVYAYIFEGPKQGANPGATRAVAVLSHSPKHAPYVIPSSEKVKALDLFGNPIAVGQPLGATLAYLAADRSGDLLATLGAGN